ncbi:Octicosapeptide/Phox/Bem1p family protein, putative [Theobroma cacao]|uniref:Octicosapeptide/Phox/Bem1p family protein, putative n=1 Tax=Theobroma cacao TaxID=3641 RepID=A0A061EP39_THECC|nr:Octicosapeptide/Phox/Bem1p family protein, putative [Theobroma cacao]
MDPPPTTTPPKLRLMCSYGGHIIPRPQTKSLYYSGGENRIITIPPTTAPTLTLSSLTTHLSTFLHLGTPFVLKYQLPHHDLNSLISISTDDDLQIMLEERCRLSSTGTPSRVRLFIFPVVNSVNAELSHPKRESWFVDALRSARVGFGGEISSEQESIVLETSSSFGSTSSSHSLSNLPPIKPSSDSIPSDDRVGSAVSNVRTGTCQDQVAPFAATENKASSNPFEPDNKVADPSSGIELHKPIQASGSPINLVDLPQQQTQFVLEGTHYIPQNMPGVQPVTSYYPVYHPLPPQQQHLHYQSNQPYPLYYLPVVPTQSYSIPMQCGMVQASSSSIGSGQPQIHPNASLIPPQRVIKEVAALLQPVADLTSQTYKNVPGHPLIHLPYNETETRPVGAQIQHSPQAFGVAAGETANCTSKLDDDPARVQIYKSQPPPPMLPSQYQTMTKATTLLLSEALGQLHTDDAKQQIRTSEPQ